jgi:FAD/FMN-containing dehydrogenase
MGNSTRSLTPRLCAVPDESHQRRMHVEPGARADVRQRSERIARHRGSVAHRWRLKPVYQRQHPARYFGLMSAKMLPATPAVDARVSDILHQAAVRAKTGSICEIMQEKILCVARRYQMRHDTAGWQLLGARHHAGVPAAYAMNRTSVFGATDITRLTEMSQQIFAWPSCKLRRTKHPALYTKITQTWNNLTK